MAQGLKALTVHAEDPGLVSSLQIKLPKRSDTSGLHKFIHTDT